MTRLYWVPVVLVSLVLAGCGEMAAETPSFDGDCGGNAVIVSLTASPPVVARGTPVMVVLEWQTRAPLDAPAAVLLAADGSIEVVVPLADEVSEPTWTYRGSIGNPFGALAPAGEVGVLAEGEQPGCRVRPTATTSFMLE